jgi:hypothetical protein
MGPSATTRTELSERTAKTRHRRLPTPVLLNKKGPHMMRRCRNNRAPV